MRRSIWTALVLVLVLVSLLLATRPGEEGKNPRPTYLSLWQIVLDNFRWAGSRAIFAPTGSTRSRRRR
jgi:hypothetical protein